MFLKSYLFYEMPAPKQKTNLLLKYFACKTPPKMTNRMPHIII